MGLGSVDGLLHRIQAQSPSTPTSSGLCTDGAALTLWTNSAPASTCGPGGPQYSRSGDRRYRLIGAADWTRSAAVRTAPGVEALIGDAQPLHRPARDQVLGDNLRGVFGPHLPVPDGLRVDHHRGAVLALVKAAGFVDPDTAAQAGFFRQLLEPGVQFALSVHGAGRPRRIRGADIMTDKNMVFEDGQAVISLLRIPAPIVDKNTRCDPATDPETYPETDPGTADSRLSGS